MPNPTLIGAKGTTLLLGTNPCCPILGLFNLHISDLFDPRIISNTSVNINMRRTQATQADACNDISPGNSSCPTFSRHCHTPDADMHIDSAGTLYRFAALEQSRLPSKQFQELQAGLTQSDAELGVHCSFVCGAQPKGGLSGGHFPRGEVAGSRGHSSEMASGGNFISY